MQAGAFFSGLDTWNEMSYFKARWSAAMLVVFIDGRAVTSLGDSDQLESRRLEVMLKTDNNCHHHENLGLRFQRIW
jgi:hypothetical protein